MKQKNVPIEKVILRINIAFTTLYKIMSKKGQIHLPMDEPIVGLPRLKYRTRFQVKHLLQCLIRDGSTQKALWMHKVSNKKLREVCAQLP